MKFAIIQTGGKQYKVSEGAKLKVEKLEAEAGSSVTFDKVLLTYDEANGVQLGKPFIDGVSINGEVLEHGKGDKIIIFKYKPKKRERKKTGHRQPYTLVQIKGLGEKEKTKAPVKKTLSRSKTKTRT